LAPASGEAAASTKAALLKPLDAFPGINVSANTFLTERVNETFSGYTSPVAVNVFGDDLNAIDEAAVKIADVLRHIPGAASVQMQAPQGLPQLTIGLRRADLERWGLAAADVLDAVRTAYQGEVVGQNYEGDRVFDVVVRLVAPSHSKISQLSDMPLRAPDGVYVPLSRVADIAAGSGLYEIQHQGGRRLQAITLDVEGRDLASFVKDAREQIAAKVMLPSATYVQFSGAAEGQAQAQRDLAMKAVFAGIGIVLLLSVITRNWRNLLLLMANLPFTFVGGVAAAFVAGGVLSLGSLVGFVTLFGITLRNSMMMIAHYEHLVAVDGRKWDPETAVLGAADRLAAVVMTSLVTGLGLLPLAIGMNAAGREIEGPMALVILGGLVTSTALNLLILPILALRYGRFVPAGVELKAAPRQRHAAE